MPQPRRHCTWRIAQYLRLCKSTSLATNETPHISHEISLCWQPFCWCVTSDFAGTEEPQPILHFTRRSWQNDLICTSRLATFIIIPQPCMHSTSRAGHSSRSWRFRSLLRTLALHTHWYSPSAHSDVCVSSTCDVISLRHEGHCITRCRQFSSWCVNRSNGSRMPHAYLQSTLELVPAFPSSFFLAGAPVPFHIRTVLSMLAAATIVWPL
mmetsp:Transcript_30917/g.45231  ORF Transcript_30917/g.45231 Transcript_30917/m.45231 type:complete len:210 (+) Transcript_30917:576-1205(+)